MMIVDYLRFLTDRARERRPVRVAERAYELTVDKFSRLPEVAVTGSAAGRRPVDCRHYFRAWLEYLRERHGIVPECPSLAAEQVAAAVLQRLVLHHFQRSLAESHRSQGKTRYTWQVAGGELVVLMPRAVVGTARQAWLATHVTEVDPRRPFERERVQRVIDEQFPDEVSLEALGADRVGFAPAGLGRDPLATEGLAASVDGVWKYRAEKPKPTARQLF